MSLVPSGPPVDACVRLCNATEGNEPLVSLNVSSSLVVSEGSATGAAVILDLSTVLSVLPSRNVTVQYGVIDQSYHVAVDPSSGHVTLTSPLDFERQQQHPVTIYAWASTLYGVPVFNTSTSAMQSGSQICVANASTVLDVININDNAPQFSQQTFSIVVTSNHASILETLIQVSLAYCAALVRSVAFSSRRFSILPVA